MSTIERKLLSFLTDPAEIARVYQMGVRGEVFEEPLCRAVFDYTINYWLHEHMERAPTAYVIEHELPGFKFETDVEESPAWLAEVLQRRFVTNQLQEMLRTAATTSVQDPASTLKKLYTTAYDASEAVAPRNTRSNMSNIDERRRRYTARSERPEGIGLPLGIRELDEHTGGLMPGELAAVGAFSKTGKTFFLANTAVHLRKAGHTPIIFTLEMNVAEIEDRIDAMFSEVSYNRLTHGRLGIDEMRDYHRGQEKLVELGGVLVESPEEGDRTAAHLTNRARQAGADFMIIDQLSHMDASVRTRDLKEHHGNVMKGLSVEISRPGKEIPCLLAVQLRRPDNSTQQAVELWHFANAAEVEREVDLALGLSRTGEMRRNRAMKLDILGARRSDVKSWLLQWDLVESSRIQALEEIR